MFHIYLLSLSSSIRTARPSDTAVYKLNIRIFFMRMLIQTERTYIIVDSLSLAFPRYLLSVVETTYIHTYIYRYIIYIYIYTYIYIYIYIYIYNELFTSFWPLPLSRDICRICDLQVIYYICA